MDVKRYTQYIHLTNAKLVLAIESTHKLNPFTTNPVKSLHFSMLV